MVGLEFYGAVVEGGEERFGEGEFGHFVLCGCGVVEDWVGDFCVGFGLH